MRDTTGNPERARFRHLARSGSQTQYKIWLIAPPHGASHIIKVGYGMGVLVAMSCLTCFVRSIACQAINVLIYLELRKTLTVMK